MTGEIKVSALLPISKLIAKHIKPIPPVIFRLFKSVIAARSATNALFQQLVAKSPDPEIEKSNASHRSFIEKLSKAFELLGGEEWVKEQNEVGKSVKEDEQSIAVRKLSLLIWCILRRIQLRGCLRWHTFGAWLLEEEYAWLREHKLLGYASFSSPLGRN